MDFAPLKKPLDDYTIFADFNNADRQGRVRLNTVGTFEDLQNQKIEPIEGMTVYLNDSDSLKAFGRVMFSKEENIWVAEINRKDLFL